MPIIRLSSEYDPVTGKETNIKPLVTEATVVSLPSGSLTGTNFDNRFKEDLKTNKVRFFYIAAQGLSFEPQSGDIFIFENRVWDIAGSTPLNPAGIPVLYTIGGMISGKIDIVALQKVLESFDLTFPSDWTL